MKALLKQFVPKFLLSWYHWTLAQLAVLWYAHPSRHLVVVGVTGTKGKSTVANLVERIFSGAGYATGLISTVQFKVNEQRWDNQTKQTMPGRFTLQRLLRQMVSAGCSLAVVETSSEGIAQYRHLGIEYDVAVFTNLSPEHIESHGSFERYRAAKLKLFAGLARGSGKVVGGRRIKKFIVANHDDDEAEAVLQNPADRRYTFGLRQPSTLLLSDEQVIGREVEVRPHRTSFVVDGVKIDLRLLGEFNVYNALAAVAVGFSQGLELEGMKKTLESIEVVPGRLEEIGNEHGYRVFVDYAHEPASLEAVYKTLVAFQPRRIISVLGSQGGGRDKAKRAVLGQLAASYTDHVIVTNEDPYDEDPEKIIDDVARGASSARHRAPVEKIPDRREAIRTALSLAGRGDIVIITGKGSETVMAVSGGNKVPWDDRAVVRELLKNIS